MHRYQWCVTGDGQHHQHFVTNKEGRPLLRSVYTRIGSEEDRFTREFLQRAVDWVNEKATARSGG